MVCVCVDSDINLVKNVAESLSGDLCKERLLDVVGFCMCGNSLQVAVVNLVCHHQLSNEEAVFVGWRQLLMHRMKLAAWVGSLSICAAGLLLAAAAGTRPTTPYPG
jgi:hypothetical protein